jgi:hypothetical protein
MKDFLALFPDAVLYRPRELQGDVLVQAAAESNVRKLRAAADGKYRLACFSSGAKKLHLEPSPAVRRKRQVRAGQRPFAVEGGADVVSAGEDESVQSLHQIGDRCIDPWDRQGYPARRCHGTAVIKVENVQVTRGLFQKVHRYTDKGLHTCKLQIANAEFHMHPNPDKPDNVLATEVTENTEEKLKPV